MAPDLSRVFARQVSVLYCELLKGRDPVGSSVNLLETHGSAENVNQQINSEPEALSAQNFSTSEIFF